MEKRLQGGSAVQGEREPVLPGRDVPGCCKWVPSSSAAAAGSGSKSALPIPNLGPQGPASHLNKKTYFTPPRQIATTTWLMEPVNYERVKEYSQKDLERQPDNAKALYRAGVAFFHLQDYDQARHYLMAAVNRKPKDANVRRYLQWTQLELSSYHRKEKQLYLGMFG
uniref:Tetratricopeptide repeat protein 9C n=1 Tax=Bos mutus grunniens TaxID=30521 RepID=A0A8B9X212_BOSMU